MMLAFALALSLIAQAPEMHRYKVVTDDGLHVIVKGWVKPGASEVTYYSDDPYNMKAIAEARKSRYATNGVVRKPKKNDAYTVPSEEAREFVSEALRDVAGGTRLHVTVIGEDSQREPVMKDIETNPAFADVREYIDVQGYKPGEWAVDPSLGFKAGTPSIIVQSGKSAADPAGGKVLYRVQDYSKGPVSLAEAIRKANPSYKPELDPTGASKGKCPLGFTKEHGLVAGAIGLMALLVAPRKKE